MKILFGSVYKQRIKIKYRKVFEKLFAKFVTHINLMINIYVVKKVRVIKRSSYLSHENYN